MLTETTRELELDRPPSGRFLPRHRLSDLLDAKPWARLAVVSAPAGFGKTTAVSEWATSPHIHAATVALDASDNDFVRFVREVARALSSIARTALADGGTTIDAASGVAAASVLEWLRLVATDTGTARVALVLDDYHLIEESRIHRLVAEVVDRLPERCLVVIVCRADPPIALARLRGRDELIEIRADDLRFSSAETRAFLQASGIELVPTDLEALTSRTEGWAAVLRLAAIALLGRSDLGDAVRRFGASHRFVFDYIVEEVLAGLPADTVAFLLRTAVLDRLCADLCNAITERTDAQRMLEALERANLLIVPLDDERRWYRYHALFAEILRARLAMEHGNEIRVLHERASRWYEEHGRDDEAIHHAVASGDLDRAAGLVSDASLQWLNAGELATVRGWLDALGPNVVRGIAQLSLSYGWCLALTHRLDEADVRVADAEGAHQAGRDGGPLSGPVIPAELALLRAYIAGIRGDSATAIAAASSARELIPSGLPLVFEATLRGDATVFLARALLVAGSSDMGFETYVAALPDLRAGRNILALGRAMNDLAIASIDRGDPATAFNLCEQELELTPAIATSAPYWGALAKLREALGEAAAARDAAQRALELAVRAGDARIAGWARETLERLAALPRATTANGPTPNDALVEPLTDRELEVLVLVADGRTNSQIAKELFVTVGTVKSHVHSISGKLGASNRVEAVALARRLRLID